MFHKFINRNEDGQTEMNDSALRDIIPSNDVDSDDHETKKPRRKRCLHVCKMLVFTMILGLLAIGIVVLAFILAYSGKSFVNFIVRSAESNSFLTTDSNSTSTPYQEHSNDTLKKITVVPISTDEQVRRLSSLIRIKQEYRHLSTHTPSTAKVNKPTTMSPKVSLLTTIKTQEYIQTSREDKITTVETFTSLSPIEKIQDDKTATSSNIPLTTHVPSTNGNPNKRKLATSYKKNEDEDLMDDLFFS